MATKAVEIAEAKVTGKCQITIPGVVRDELGIAAGDRLRFVRLGDGGIGVRTRKRRSILDIARENPLSFGEAGKDLVKLIDEATTERILTRERRSRDKASS